MRASSHTTQVLHLAARTIQAADAILVGAGAGMGVDSGLPDFRGTEGFWKAYPPSAPWGWGSKIWRNPDGFARIRRSPGDSTVTA